MPRADVCVLLDKPEGVTSAALVARAKRRCGWAKLGHAGTLDRFASGLMLLFAGKATRLCPVFVGLDKRYWVRVTFGVETATLDPEGEVVARASLPPPERVHEALRQLVAQREQRPPDFSALHVAGTRAYKLALQGQETGLRPRAVRLYSTEVLCQTDAELELRLHCSSGYYVRAFARDLGRLCGSCAHVSALRREAIGPFELRDALKSDDIDAEAGAPPMRLLRKLTIPLLEASSEWSFLLRDGKMPPLTPVAEGTYLLHRGDRLLSMVEYREERWHFRANFYPGI